MTRLRCRNLDQFIVQNKAVVEDCAEGCLQDNFLLQCKRGVAVAVETYENSNSSVHTIMFVRYGSKDELNELYRYWDGIAYYTEDN